MTAQPNDADFGPLPRSDRPNTLQRLSIKALLSLLPEEKLLFRRESEEDKGVDGTLEAILPGGFTNFRAHVQLKSTDSRKRNDDGSASYTIETTNLNYMLNAQSSIYFLWIEPAKEMRYAWARDEWQTLETNTPDWKNQGSFTIRFRYALDAKAVDLIHERIIREARFGREIHETLARSSLLEHVVVRIDPQTLATDNPDELFRWITSSGMTIVSSGFGKLALEWLNALRPTQRQDARVQLVAAFAQVSLGRYQGALGPLADARMGWAHLSESDRQVLDYLQDVCRYHTGKMDQDEYLRRERERGESRTGTSAAQHRMEVLRLEHLDQHDRRRRAQLLQKMGGVCQEIESAPDAAPAQKILARVSVMYAEGDDLVGKFMDGAMRVRVRRDMGLRVDEVDRRTARDVDAAWRTWDGHARGLVQEAERERHPLLLAEAITARLTVYQNFLDTQRMVAFANNAAWEPDVDLCAALAREVEQAMEVFHRAGSLEGETRAKLVLADFRYLAGNRKSADTLAREALVVAQAMCYPKLESHAREYTDGPTSFEQFQATQAERQSQDEDVIRASDTDERVKALALRHLETLRLPAERLPVAERVWLSLRLISRERLEWCRHINLLQRTSDLENPATGYLTDPAKVCRCEKHLYTSNIENPDSETVISAFKRAYCDGCPDRDPKGWQGG
jgi:hypothetical protein